MRILITGATGFVGSHLADQLLLAGKGDVVIIATAKQGQHHATMGPIEALDVTDPVAVIASIARHRPDHVIHLAGIAAPTEASADPERAWRVHVRGALNVADAILESVPNCWLHHVGSGLIYGESANTGLPLDEATLLAPIDTYGVTKAAADLAIGAMARRGLKCVRFRPFNHVGTGQSESFVIPAFAMQIARIEVGRVGPVIRVGNLDAERDFLDVRDVARAYALSVLNSAKLRPGSIFNIASGIPRRIGDILERLLSQSRIAISVDQDSSRLRPSDLPRIVGDAHRARVGLGWTPTYSFDDTLTTILDDCRSRLT